ncbi:golgin IMH1-like [Nicotiana tomentosiformis]|uniref:golgin IMH1-like n=1 Tax=Nicotiana tomentosiformis TaxID=4098 RepID=UPI00388CADF7
MYTRFTTLTNELKFLGRIIREEDRSEKILTRVSPITWERKITAIQESKNIATLPLDELIGNLTAYELRRQTIKMDIAKKERSLALRITEGFDLEDDEISMITKDFKKYLRRGKCSSISGNYSKSKSPEKQTNDGCYKCGKTDHHIKNCPLWEIELKKERAERKNTKKEQVQPKKSKNNGSTKAVVAAWGESSDKSSDDDEDEQALMAIGESDEETEVSIIHLKDKIKLLSKERLSGLLLELIDESEDVNNEKEQLSKECVILKATCKNLELRVSETVSESTMLKNQVHALDSTVLELRSENLKLKLGTCKNIVDHTQLTLEENVGKMKDELYKRDEQVRILKEDLSKVKHELDKTCKWNRSSCALSGYKNTIVATEEDLALGTWHLSGIQKVQVKGNNQIWYMDSGCSKHMTESKNQFLSLEDLKGGNVSFEIGKKGEIIGVGKEHDNEAIGLVRNSNEITTQTEAAPEEGTYDGTSPSTHGNLTGGTEQRGSDPQISREPVHEPIPQQQNTEGTSRGNQLVVKPYKYQSSHPIENIITDSTSEIKTRSSLKNLCAFDSFLSLIEPKNIVEALQDADWVNAMQDELN